VLVSSFLDAASRYWLTVFPRARWGLRHWRDRAGQIPDPTLRQLALDSLRESGNIEGAAAFAAFAPRAHRGAVVRALVAFQAAYNYADLLSEQSHEQSHEETVVANGRRLHQALLMALDLSASQPDYYAHYPQCEDGGYLRAMVDACRAALSTLPSYAAVAESAHRAAERIVVFQSLNVGKAQGDHEAFARWARRETATSGTDLEWWETAAAAGSSLGVHVLIAAAADGALERAKIVALDDAYFPWIGALHSLLDNLIDRQEDARTNQHSLVGYYASSERAAARLQMLAVEAMDRARALPRGSRHAIIVAAMVGNYLSTPEAKAPDVRAISQNVLEAIGDLASPTLLVFRLRRLVGGVGHQAAVDSSAVAGTSTVAQLWDTEAQVTGAVREAD
jgi:tetraprenyl-beta-curcumene synthase